MYSHQPVHRVAIVGTGVIGASWATHYLARGFDVVATDPAPGAEAALRAYVDASWDGAAAPPFYPTLCGFCERLWRTFCGIATRSHSGSLAFRAEERDDHQTLRPSSCLER